MTISLAKDVEEFLHEQLRAGACSDPSDLVNDVLRSLREQLRRSSNLSPELEAWLLETADLPSTPLTTADFEGIRERVRDRRSSRS